MQCPILFSLATLLFLSMATWADAAEDSSGALLKQARQAARQGKADKGIESRIKGTFEGFRQPFRHAEYPQFPKPVLRILGRLAPKREPTTAPDAREALEAEFPIQ